MSNVSKVQLPQLPNGQKGSDMSFSEIFNFLTSIDVEPYCEKVGKFKYLQWATAWQIIATYFNVSFKICSFDGKDFCATEEGCLVKTEVTINGTTLPMIMSLIDAANKPQKAYDYSYTITATDPNTKAKTTVTKTCYAFNAFNIANAHVRCLTKNLSLFGLGLNLYQTKEFSGVLDDEELNLSKSNSQPVVEKQSSPSVQSNVVQSDVDNMIALCQTATTREEIRWIGARLQTESDLAKTPLRKIYCDAFKLLPNDKAA